MLQRLIAKQKALKMNDTQFARLLNISRPLWSLNRRGIQPLGQKTLKGAMQFPELIPDVLRFLQGDGHEDKTI